MKPPTINAELFTIIECVLLHSASRFEFIISVDDESIAKDIPAVYPVYNVSNLQADMNYAAGEKVKLSLDVSELPT